MLGTRKELVVRLVPSLTSSHGKQLLEVVLNAELGSMVELGGVTHSKIKFIIVKSPKLRLSFF